MNSKILINVDNLDYLEDYRKAGINAFLFALDGYNVGYNTYSLEEINKIEVSNKYILINRVLDCQSIDNLKEIINNLTNIKGIVFEDIGVYNLIKDLNIEKILFQNHFCTNSKSINFWLDRVDSVFVGNELTKEELTEISNNTNKPVCMHLYGYNQVMYSRRLLLTNWCNEFNVINKKNNIIEDISSKVKFRVVENDYGTVFYSYNIFNGHILEELPNIKYLYVNPTLIDHKTIMDFLNTRSNHDNEDDGFLNKETIYKIREVK